MQEATQDVAEWYTRASALEDGSRQVVQETLVVADQPSQTGPEGMQDTLDPSAELTIQMRNETPAEGSDRQHDGSRSVSRDIDFSDNDDVWQPDGEGSSRQQTPPAAQEWIKSPPAQIHSLINQPSTSAQQHSADMRRTRSLEHASPQVTMASEVRIQIRCLKPWQAAGD